MQGSRSLPGEDGSCGALTAGPHDDVVALRELHAAAPHQPPASRVPLSTHPHNHWRATACLTLVGLSGAPAPSRRRPPRRW
jgi:hypothetical protein